MRTGSGDLLVLRLTHIPAEVADGVSFRAHEGDTGVVMRKARHHDMCGRSLRSKRNLRERCGPWSGADMCSASAAARSMPRAQMGVRRSGPIQAHALEALVGKLVFPIRSLDRAPSPSFDLPVCGPPLRSKRNLQERCGPWSGADMCAAFDAAHTPQAQMGVRGSGPIRHTRLKRLS